MRFTEQTIYLPGRDMESKSATQGTVPWKTQAGYI